ncbi:hypothetical protein CEE69_26380 [Rhodopirellula bahusiensis]|uniref:Uncharacterized protein n=1 Tax=Rhodopirellula bahusiensis TaxID=2014065 RepID=A0A2G1VZY1_9BACT|nr:hypothetical protein CEE69_26380 [Rhodopirellula bahusiensis]
MSRQHQNSSKADETKSEMNFDRCTNDCISHLIRFHLNFHQLETFLPQLREAPLLRFSAFQ